ncbi:MAG: RNA-guided endonuclease InsQ/TnpB family protein [Candidatus Hodarchaeales archaeon]|jgi:putative transposase
MIKTFEMKLYRSKKNHYIHESIDIAAQIYNHCIALHKRYYKLFGKHLNKYQLQKHLTKLKKLRKFAFWREVGSQAIQDITDRIERAFQLFFQALKSTRRVSPPSFKKQKKYKSFTLKQAGYKLLGGNKIIIGKKCYKFHNSRKIEGEIKTLTVKRDALEDLYLFFSCEVSEIQTDRVSSGKSVGFDFGLKCFLTLSDGSEIESPEFFKKGLKTIRKASKNLSRRKKGSKNRNKARQNLARVHKKISNQRKDYQFKLAKNFSETYDALFFEDLNMKSMQKIWGRKVNDLGFSTFLDILGYYCSKTGAKIQKIDSFYPSSKTCHCCNYIFEELTLKDREWSCPNCHSHHSRDVNAAKNIHRVGASTLGVGEVRLAFERAFTVDPRISIHS